jgi:hypothetical protein
LRTACGGFVIATAGMGVSNLQSKSQSAAFNAASQYRCGSRHARPRSLSLSPAPAVADSLIDFGYPF